MSKHGTKPGRVSVRVLWGALALGCALPLAAQAQQTVYWRNGAGVSNWWDGANPWYRSCDGWWIARPDYNTCGEASTIGANIIHFDNGSDLTMSINGAYFQAHQILFDSGTGARTMTARDSGGIDMRSGSSTVKIENNDADAQVLNAPVVLYATTEINPVSGNLTLHGTLNNNSYWVNVWGANQKTLNLNGVVSGSGGLAVKQDSLVALTNNNTFTGAIWIEKGTVQVNTHTNAIGQSGIVNVGTNATLDLQYGAASLRPATLNLYGTGTNATWGALRKATASATTWRGIVSNWTDSRIVVTAGGLTFTTNIVAGSSTLYITNAVGVSMSGGEMTGSKTTGDGAIHKTGSGALTVRPGSGLTGSILLHQGEIRQDTGSDLPSGGTLVMSNSTTYRAVDTVARASAKASRIDGGVTLGYAGGGRLTFSGNMDLNGAVRTITAANDVTLSGTLSNGGLTKAGTGTMILLGTNTHALGTTLSAGVLQIGSNGTAGSVSGNITNNAALAFYRSDATTYSSVISGTGALTNRAGTLTLSGANTLSGASRVAGGMVVVSGSLGSSAVTVDSGAALGGAGSVGALTVNGTVSPGNATNNSANLGCAALTLGSGGAYVFNIANAAGAPGTDWDKVTGSGTLTVNGSGTFTIHVNGAATGFSSSTSYSWPILSGSSVSGFDAARFAVITNNFSAPTAGGAFSVAQSTTNIVLVFTPAAPPTPADLAASDGTSTAHVALSWTDGAGETGYVIWRHTADVPAGAAAIYTNGANVATYNDTEPTAGTLYYYWVSATNAAGSSAKSTSNSGFKRLSAPANLAATDGSSTATVTVTWDAATGADTYHLYRDTDSDPAGATALGPQSSGYADAPTPGTLFTYWVLASNSATTSTSDWSTANSGYRKLPVVAGVLATSNLSDKVTVTWTDSNDGETGYTVWRHTADVSGSAALISGAALGADAVSYDDTTAVAGTPYWYWVRATNSTSTSQSDFSTSYGGLRQLTEPTTAATNITFSSVATTSMTVGWTRGSSPGDYVLVVAKQGSAPTDPSDSTAYTDNAAFGSGDQTAAGSYVVYKGTGTSVPVTALSAATEYYFAVYEFNGVTTPNYRTSDEPVSNKYTVAAEPTTQATSLVVTGTNEVSLTGINWTDGNGASRLVVVKAGSAVDSFPVDGATYTANAAFGSGTQIGTGNYVVHAGSGPLATLSSLTRDTTYHIRVFEFNGSGATANYLTNSASGNPISKITMAATPGSNPTDLTLSPIGTNGFTVTWTQGTTGTNTLIVIRAGGNPVDPSDLNSYTANPVFGSGSDLGSSSFVVFNGTVSSVTVTNLVPGTSYTVEASSFNGGSGSENYRGTPTSTTGSTLTVEPAQATSLAFGTLGSTSYAVSYTAGNGLSRLVVAKAGSAVTFLPTDATAYTGENNNIGSATDLGGGNLLVHRGTSPFTLSGLTAATDYHLRIFEYQGTNATLNYNTNAASGNPSNRYTLSTEPSAHGTLAATALSDTQVRLDWGDATGESGYLIVRKAGSAPTGTPVDGTAYAQGNAIGDGTVVYVATAAGAGSVTDSYSTVAATAYYYQIFAVADDGTPAHATHNYRTAATVPEANATTGSSEPATSSTLSSFVQASSTSATINWTNTGSADGTIILVKSGGAVSSNPSDWTGYTPNTAFGSGDEIGAGNFVVYAAAGKYGSVTITGLSAGTTYHVAVYPYNGGGSFPNYRTTSPATGSLAILPAPTAQTATADGKTLVDLAWTKNASYDVMIVYKAGSASTDPTQGQAYSVGDACGGGVVIYKGSGSALEHIVASGTDHYYAFYSYNGNYYSSGATDSESTTSFVAGEVVETFSYTNSTALTGLSGSNGWGGAWYGDTTLFTNSSGSFATQTNYPAPAGNKLWVSPANDANVSVFRPLGQEYKSGKIYFGYVLNYQYEGADKYEGLSLYWTNTNEKLFIGEIGSQDQQLGIDSTGSAYTLTKGAGNDYIIVGYYDWGAGEAKAKAFKIGTAAVPTEEPSSWDVTVSKASNTVGTVNTIRLAAGEFGAGSGTPGNTYFDEVRIATSWSDLVGVLPSKPADPSGQLATADGNEMARLAWTTNAAGNGVMILHKTTAISTDPTDGSSYSIGSTIGGATVIYRSTGTQVEHVVAPGTTNFYKFYSYSGSSYYSTGVVATVTNGSYADYERVNPFSYTNAATLGSSQIGGQGFGANFWSVDSGTWTAQTNYSTAVADSVPKFINMSNYPAMAGNLVVASDPGNGASAKAQRSLSSAINSGTFYIAFMMSYQYRGANKWAGISLFNGSTEKAFFGKGAGGNWSTLGIGDGATTYWSAYDMGEFYTGTGNSGNVYLVVGKYDFGSQQLAAKAYRIPDGLTFPETEPSWDVTTTLGTGIDSIDRIKLNTGSTDAGATIGKVFFDEIRYATNWSGLLAVTCPTWAGSNTLSNTNTWLGDIESFQFQSYPVGLGQSGSIELDWAKDGAFATTNAMTWKQNANNNSYWSNQVQMTTAGNITSRFAAAGSACSAVRTNNPRIVVSNLVAPSAATAARDAVNTNSQINLTWTRGVSGTAKDTLIVRRAGAAPDVDPVNGTTYNPGDALGSGTVVYRGSGTNFSDTGLAPSTTYYYWFYAENWTYYSAGHDTANSNTLAGGQAIVIDGSSADWVGSPSAVLNNSASSLQEYIWTDKKGEQRTDSADHPNGDITEFRVFADSTWVYFLVKMTNITDTTKPFVAIGVDTRTNSGSTAMNWIGDDSGAFIGDGYAQGGAAHYPEYQLNIHSASTVPGAPRIEMFTQGGTAWYAPPTGGNTNVAFSVANDVIEVKVARADLNLNPSGAVTARFTVASFINTGAWNNDGDGTAQLAVNTADAMDAISIPPWGTPDNSANLSAWLEDLSDADIDFWVDVKFGATGLSGNSRPPAPVLVSPTNTAAVTASPNLTWQAPVDSDGQVTGYLLEISTNEQFNGVSGTENGTVDLRVHLYATTTNYTFTTSATQYWWRVRARDTAGELSLATTRQFRVVGKLDTEGPRPTLLYIGTNVAGYLAGDYDARIAQYGPIQSVLDSELRNTNNVFGFVLRWEDATGVYATNKMRSTDSPPSAGGFAFNIVSTDGRVSPNWDIVEYTEGSLTKDWAKDAVFYATNTMATGNGATAMTNYVHVAFAMTNYNPSIDYYLTVSAEDTYTDGGSWWSYGSWPSFTNSAAAMPYYSGWCEDGPNTARNITTNYLIEIDVVDDDIIAPEASTALAWANEASMVVSNAAGPLAYESGTGQDVLYEVTDGSLIGGPLSFSFNAYDSYYQGIALGTNTTYTESGRTLTNSAFVAAYWQTNWANYDASRSVTTDTRNANTMLTWHWPSITTQDVTALWGPDSLTGELGVTNLIQMDLFDVDNDRTSDQANARVNFGRIQLVDDDVVNPVISNESLSVTGTGLASEYLLANLVEWDFTGASGDPVKLTSTNVAAGVTSSPISLDTGSILGTDIITVSAGFAGGSTRSWLFTLTPATTDKTFKATSISFDSKVSSVNGPDTWELYGTMPGGAETLWASDTIDLSDPDNPIGTNWNAYGAALAMPAAATNTVQFRLMAYVADTNHLTGTGNATWSVDNLIVSGYILGQAGGTQVTDHDLAKGTVRFAANVHDVYSGVYASTNEGRAPRVDFWHTTGVPVTNGFFTNGLASNGAAQAATTVWGYAPAADRTKIQGGRTPTNYTARFLVNDYDVDRDGDSRTETNTLANVPVYDDDTNAPVRGFKYGGPLGVFVDGSITKAASSGYTREYRINDEQLQSAAATSITVKVNLYDFSGFTVPTLSFSNAVDNVLSTNGWLTSLLTDTVDTTNQPDAEMVWTLDKSQADTLFSTRESTVNVFRVVSSWDKDDDRLDGSSNNIDNMQMVNARLGHLTFIDNDVGQANLQSSWSVSRTNWNIPRIYIGLPGDAGSSNLLINGDTVLANTNANAVLADMVHRVYDSQLAKASAALPLSVVLPIYDTGGGGAGRTIKGVQRGTTLTEASTNGGAHTITNTWINIGTVKVQNASAYRSDLSSSLARTKIAAQFPTSVWTFTSFSYAEVGSWLPAAAVSSNQALNTGIYDADDNRPGDQKYREVPFGTLRVLDNDTVAPTLPTNLMVNGVPATGTWTRATAPWTNQPEFRIRFEPSTDGAPAGDDLEATGVGEHRVATAKADIGPDLGTPLAVPSESSLANYGFENGATNWALVGAVVTTNQAYEGQRSVQMTNTSARQIVQLLNTNGYAPRVTILGVQFMGSITGTVTVAGLNANGTTNSSFQVSIVGTNGQWVAGSSGAQTLAAAVDAIEVTLFGVGYWDDVRVQIEMLNGGTPVDDVASLFLATEQGLTTNYLFAVDRDNNRAGDRKASSAPADAYIPSFGTAYDITPPTAVPVDAASSDDVDDPTTQFDIEWSTSGVGPDDEGHDDYPSGYSGTDVLAPWRSYKVYYGTFDPLEVPGGDLGPGNGNAYIFTNFIATGAYSNWLAVSSTNAVVDPSAGGANYLALTNLASTQIRLYDLDYDQDYAVIVVGVDQAGNEGPANPSSWATNNTIKFAVTQGLMKARALVESAFPTNNNLQSGDKGAAALYWIASGPTNAQGAYTNVTKDYDLIYVDASSFQENTNWNWQKVGTIRSNWFTDATGLDRSRGVVRFYRASYKDRWQKTRLDGTNVVPQRPLASEEVYAMHNVVLSEGYNFVGLHGRPFTNTFQAVFGTDTNFWPRGSSPASGATKIEFYAAGINAPASDVYFFGTDANWYLSGDATPVTTNLQSSNFFARGFSITLPSPLPAHYVTTTATDVSQPGSNLNAMVWSPILQVPTNGFSHVISTGGKSGRNNTNVYNVVSLNLPVAVHPSQLNFPTNFTRGVPNSGDEIYTMNTSTKGVLSSSTIYCDLAGVWRFSTGGGVVPAGYFKPNDVIVIVSRNGGLGNSWTWTYHPTNFYNLPTRWMGN